ncbi:hypothetical protein [Vibrio inusitatus]|uniref:hypothetical protein n=1 Tax=Vibrio inusitatus TaxID=413402 RepID=UPI0011433E3E|nr:hypothetical protein [Vibrio inusitatus]
MGQLIAQQKRNRTNNSGGVGPDAQCIATTQAIALHRIHRKGDSDTVRKRKVACFLIWWIIRNWLVLSNLKLALDDCSSHSSSDCLRPLSYRPTMHMRFLCQSLLLLNKNGRIKYFN